MPFLLENMGEGIFLSDLQRALSSDKIGIFRITQNPPPAMAYRFDSGYRHHVGAPCARLRKTSRLLRLVFLRLCFGAPPSPHATHSVGLAWGPFLSGVWRFFYGNRRPFLLRLLLPARPPRRCFQEIRSSGSFAPPGLTGFRRSQRSFFAWAGAQVSVYTIL